MKTLRRIAILFFGVVFAISLFMLARILVQGRQEQAAFDRLSATLEQPESADGQNPGQSPYEALKAQNPDFFGWISIGEPTSTTRSCLHPMTRNIICAVPSMAAALKAACPFSLPIVLQEAATGSSMATT